MPTNLPSEEEFEEWRRHIDRDGFQVDKLSEEELSQLIVHIVRENSLLRIDFFEKLTEPFFAKYEKYLKDNTSLIDKSIKESLMEHAHSEIFLNEINIFMMDFRLHSDATIYHAIREFTYELTNSNIIHEICEKFKEDDICEFYSHDKHSIIELITLKMQLEQFSHIMEHQDFFDVETCDIPDDENHDRFELLSENSSLLIYSIMRYLSVYLDLKLGSYNNAKEAGETIGNIIFKRIPIAKKNGKVKIARQVMEIYGVVCRNNNTPLWENLSGKTEFNRRHQKLISLSKDEIDELKNSIMQYKEEGNILMN